MRRAELVFGMVVIASWAIGCGGKSGAGDAGVRDGGLDLAASDAGGAAGVMNAALGGASGADAASAGAGGQSGGAGAADASPPDAIDAGPAPVDATPTRDLWPSSLPLVTPARAAVSAGDPVCYASGWCWADPTPLGGSLGVWSVAADDVWVAGVHGTVRHFDGQAWTNVASPTTKDLHAIWGTGPTALWIAGDDVLLRWDGTKLAAVSGAPGGLSIGGRSATDLWVGQEAARHFDGHTWTDFGGTAGVLDLFEASDGTLYGAYDGLLLGDLMEVTPGAATAQFIKSGAAYAPHGVWAAGRTDVWLAHPYALMRFDDVSWHSALTLPSSPSDVQLIGVRGVASNDVWAGANDGSVLHWDGTKFERASSGVTYPARFAARAADDVWAAGAGGSLSHFDGQAWQRRGAGPQPGLVGGLVAVGDELWALGGAVSGTRIVRRRADGSWQEVPLFSADCGLLALAGSSGDDVWTVGTMPGPTPAGQPLLAHWDGAAWTLTPGVAQFESLWSAASDDVWMAGDELRHWDGHAWSAVTVTGAPGGARWYAVTGSSKTNVWASGFVTGPGPVFFQWDGTKWTDRSTQADSGAVTLMTVGGPTDAVAYVENVGLEHFDGQKWTALPSPPARPDTCSTRPGEVWCAAGGIVFDWNGATWSTSDTLGSDCGLIVAASHDVWVGCSAEGGGVMHLPR